MGFSLSTLIEVAENIIPQASKEEVLGIFFSISSMAEQERVVDFFYIYRLYS